MKKSQTALKTEPSAAYALREIKTSFIHFQATIGYRSRDIETYGFIKNQETSAQRSRDGTKNC